MTEERLHSVERWSSGSAYESYVGRWSREVAHEFIGWLGISPKARWLDVGCGTAALTRLILDQADPAAVLGIDQSIDYIAYTEGGVADASADFVAGDAAALPFANDVFDASVSGLVLNFVPEPSRMVTEMARATRKNGCVALYVWDYAGKMQMLRQFWDVATELDPSAARLDQGSRFSVCNLDRLGALFEATGLVKVQTRAIDIDTTFRDFDDYWRPFLGGQGSAPAYVASLSKERQTALREHLRARLPEGPDGRIRLIARALAIQGTC